MLKRTKVFLGLIALVLLRSASFAADPTAGVSGVVRDPRGVPQMGVLVELLHNDVVATAFTDLQGRYRITHISPGMYDLRTSATLLLPTLRRSLRLRAGAASVVNLTLSGIFDESLWQPTSHRSPGGDLDDWRWTLRSPANRPILRVLEEHQDGSGQPLPSAEMAASSRRRVTFASSGGVGGFGAETGRMGLGLARKSVDQRSTDVLHLSAGASGDGGRAIPFTASVFHESGQGQSMERRVVLGMRSLPQIDTADGRGLDVMEIDTAERMELGSMAALEIGGRTQALHSAGTAVVVHPFVKVSAYPGELWLVRYQYATSPDSVGWGDVGAEALAAVPTLIRKSKTGARLTEAGSHQELSVGRAMGRARVQISSFYDVQQNVAVTGLLRRRALATGVTVPSGMSIDTGSGAFRKLSPGFSGFGTRFAVDMPLGRGGVLTAAYLSAVGLSDGQTGSRSNAAFNARRASAMYIAIARSIPTTGTEASVSYRWQPTSMLTKVGQYELSNVSPYLGLHVVQHLPIGGAGSWRTELTIDATNLLAEGYHLAPEAVAQDALLMSAMREVRAGLAVSF